MNWKVTTRKYQTLSDFRTVIAYVHMHTKFEQRFKTNLFKAICSK